MGHIDGRDMQSLLELAEFSPDGIAEFTSRFDSGSSSSIPISRYWTVFSSLRFISYCGVFLMRSP